MTACEDCARDGEEQRPRAGPGASTLFVWAPLEHESVDVWSTSSLLVPMDILRIPG